MNIKKLTTEILKKTHLKSEKLNKTLTLKSESIKK